MAPAVMVLSFLGTLLLSFLLINLFISESLGGEIPLSSRATGCKGLEKRFEVGFNKGPSLRSNPFEVVSFSLTQFNVVPMHTPPLKSSEWILLQLSTWRYESL